MVKRNPKEESFMKKLYMYVFSTRLFLQDKKYFNFLKNALL